MTVKITYRKRDASMNERATSVEGYMESVTHLVPLLEAAGYEVKVESIKTEQMDPKMLEYLLSCNNN